MSSEKSDNKENSNKPEGSESHGDRAYGDLGSKSPKEIPQSLDSPNEAATNAGSFIPSAIFLRDPVKGVALEQVKTDLPEFRPGDTLKVHAKIVEGTKERIQIFEGVVIKRHKANHPNATFTVRKVSYNIGVERTFLLHSPRIAKIEVTNRGKVRRARLFYLRPLRGKAARIKARHIPDRVAEPTAVSAGE